MPQHLGLVSVVVQDYDHAIAFYVGKLGFSLDADTFQAAQNNLWDLIQPAQKSGPTLRAAP